MRNHVHNGQCMSRRTRVPTRWWLQEKGWWPHKIGIVIYMHIEGALYVQKSVPSWFLAVLTPKLMCAEIWKKLSILWYPKFQLVTVKYHGVEALFFVKCPAILKKIVSLHTKCQYQITVLGTDPVLEIGPILRHLNNRNFLIPHPRDLIDPSF